MNIEIRIGVIGDFDGRPSHLSTEDSLKHCATNMGVSLDVNWIPTLKLVEGSEDRLSGYDGLWCAPGSPYQSMLGAINAIQFARENDIPFIGTCGGFQHTALEYAKNVLRIKEISNNDFDPYSPNMFMTALSCSLVGQTKNIILDEKSFLYQLYGNNKIIEKYNCTFGLTKEFQNELEKYGLKVIGTDEEGEARVVTIQNHRFFVATLFQPQLNSTKENPHPLILEYLKSVKEYNLAKHMV